MLPIEAAVAQATGWPSQSIAFIALPEGTNGIRDSLDGLPVVLVNIDIAIDPGLIGSLNHQGYLVAGTSFSTADSSGEVPVPPTVHEGDDAPVMPRPQCDDGPALAPAGASSQRLASRRGREAKRIAALGTLTRREQRVLAEMMAGHRAAAIAKRAGVSIFTVRTQIHSILQKLGVNSQLAAVALARPTSGSAEEPSPTPRVPTLTSAPRAGRVRRAGRPSREHWRPVGQ